MQELRLVAVSEDGSYLVLATAGRGTRFTLPVDDRLRAAVRGHFSRLGQYEIEVESPLRPKEIQARIRAGETAEEIAETAGIPVERVRWFEGPVLQEREYMAQQAQRVPVRRPGESAPAPALGEIVEERLGKRGVDLEEAEWDSRKCEDSTWRVRLSFSYDGRPWTAEWSYDPRRRHISAVNEEAARLSSLDFDEAADDIVTPLMPRRAMKVVGEPAREQRPEPRRDPQPAERDVPPVREAARERSTGGTATPPRPRAAVRTDVPEERTAPPAARPTPDTTVPAEPARPAVALPPAEPPTPERTAPEAPAPTETTETTEPETTTRESARPEAAGSEAAGSEAAEPVPAAPESELAEPEPATPAAEPATPAAESPAAAKPAADPTPAEPVRDVPAKRPAEPARRQPPRPPKRETPRPAAKRERPDKPPAERPDVVEPPAAAAAGGAKPTPPPAPEKRPAARKKSRGKRASVPSWDEIMFGARRPE